MKREKRAREERGEEVLAVYMAFSFAAATRIKVNVASRLRVQQRLKEKEGALAV